MDVQVAACFELTLCCQASKTCKGSTEAFGPRHTPGLYSWLRGRQPARRRGGHRAEGDRLGDGTAVGRDDPLDGPDAGQGGGDKPAIVGDHTRGSKPSEPRRTIKTIKSLPEVSLVTFPMNELARAGAVKAADIRTVREFEDALRDVLGLSRAAAKSIAQRGFKMTTNSRRGSTALSHRCVTFAGKFRAGLQN
jgi:hypothetical protein